MKLAIIGSRGFPSTYGGFETLVRRIAPWFVSQGHDTTVYCRSRTESRLTSWQDEGVRCIYTPGIETKAASTATYGATAVLDASFRRYDAVLALNIALGPFLPVLRASGVPIALNVDGLEWLRGKWGPLARSAFRFGAWSSAKTANRLVVDSAALGRIWEEQFGVASAFIPYGADVVTDRRPELVRRVGLEPDGYVLIVARLMPENNVDLALDAFERQGWPIPVVVVGAANYDAPIARRVAQLDAANKIKWLGHVDNQELLTALWANAALYVHGHSVGGTNPALLQALGAGAPTIALDTPFNREVLADDDTLYDACPDALGATALSLIDDRERRDRARHRGRAIVADRYRWDDVCNAYLSLLSGLATVRRER